jgi:hypothetical protein
MKIRSFSTLCRSREEEERRKEEALWSLREPVLVQGRKRRDEHEERILVRRKGEGFDDDECNAHG